MGVDFRQGNHRVRARETSIANPPSGLRRWRVTRIESGSTNISTLSEGMVRYASRFSPRSVRRVDSLITSTTTTGWSWKWSSGGFGAHTTIASG
jgi:hypothetical protein